MGCIGCVPYWIAPCHSMSTVWRLTAEMRVLGWIVSVFQLLDVLVWRRLQAGVAVNLDPYQLYFRLKDNLRHRLTLKLLSKCHPNCNKMVNFGKFVHFHFPHFNADHRKSIIAEFWDMLLVMCSFIL